jgi:hypothetical protein
MKTTYSLYEKTLLYFIFCYRNSLYLYTYMINTYALSLQLSCVSKQGFKDICNYL